MSSEMKHVMDPLIHHRTCRFVTRAWKLPAGGDMTGAEDECCVKRQKVNKESDRLLSSLDGGCLEDRLKCNQTLCHSLCSLTSSPSRITLYLHDLCHHLNVTVSTPGPPSVTVLCSSVRLSVSSVSCLVLLFLRIRCLHDYLLTCPSVRPAEPADDLLLHWNHLTLFFCLLSGPVLFVEWESQTQVRGSPHFIRFILRGTWLSERFQGL